MIAGSLAQRSSAAAHAVPIALAAAALAARPISYLSSAVLIAVAATAWIGMRQLDVPLMSRARPAHIQILVGALALAAFSTARWAIPGFGLRLSILGVATLLLAGVCEEIFFRGYMHAVLRRVGVSAFWTATATASLFALIHVPLYGAWVLPIDIAAGAIFAWQRHVTGSWLVPAVTHAAANLLQMG